jgi:hypothetical protein
MPNDEGAHTEAWLRGDIRRLLTALAEACAQQYTDDADFAPSSFVQGYLAALRAVAIAFNLSKPQTKFARWIAGLPEEGTE